MPKNKQSKEELDFIQMIEEKLGEFSVINDEKLNEQLEVIKTGSLSLDVSTGIGGIPKGKTTEIYGSEASGKTTLALSIANQAILANNKVLYIDAENTMDYDRIKAVVSNYTPDKFILVQPQTMENTLFVAEEGIKSGEFGLIILDSIGSLAPKKVLEDELTDSNVALLSRMLTTFVQRNSFQIRNNNVAFVGINQVRDKIGSYFGGFETPGGHAWKHSLSLRIFLSKMADITQGSDTIGISTKFTVKKNKLAAPFRTFTIPILFDRGVDEIRDIVEFATMLNVLKKRGSYYTFEDNTLEIGIAKTIKLFSNNLDLLDKVKKACYNILNINTEERENEDE